MLKKNYKDVYGCTATIQELSNGTFQARSWTSGGRSIRDTNHKSFNAALSALKRDSDGLKEVSEN